MVRIALAIIAQAVTDYTDATRLGNMELLADVADFFYGSDACWFETLCDVAEISASQVRKRAAQEGARTQ